MERKHHARLPVLQPQRTTEQVREGGARRRDDQHVLQHHRSSGVMGQSSLPRDPDGECFAAGKPATTQSLILALNRHGRDLETRRAMLRQLSQMWTRITGQPEAELWISVTETDHTNVMEAGSLIPAPGHEHEWFEENGERLAESISRAV